MVEEQDNFPASEDFLRRTIDEISSIISLSHTIRVFSIKWQLIRSKLEQINAALTAAADHHPSASGHRHLLSLIAGVNSTISETRHLGTRCLSSSFSGKLLMQSDLDLLITKLDAHFKNLSTLFSAVGVLSETINDDDCGQPGFALVVSRPGNGATRDELRFYFKDLHTRLKIGDTDMKHQALVSLNEIVIVQEDERIVKLLVDMDDFVVLLASLLDSCDSRVREEAVVAIGVISTFDAFRGVLVNSGVIAPLIRVIECGTLGAKLNSVQCLQKLTINGDNAWAFSAHGGVTALMNICSNQYPHQICPELIANACWVLRNLVVVEEIKRFMVDEGAIQISIKLIKENDDMVQIGAVEFLQSLASGDESLRHSVVKEGGVRVLVRVLDPKAAVSFKSRETALRAIENLCFPSLDYVNLIISYGFLDQILYFLRKGDVSIQELAFKSASRLCGTSEEARKSMGDVGFMAEFVKFLEAKSYQIREMAAEALASMVTVPKNRKKFGQEDYNIGLILQLLDPKQGNSGNIKFLLSILLSLSSCNHARRKITHSGYLKNLEKLAENGVSDAKKLVRKLSTNRFKSMLNGIWHS